MKTRKLTVSVFAILLAILILPLNSYAEQTRQTIQKQKPAEKSGQTTTEINITKNPTQKMNLIEYTELAMKRFIEFNNKYKKGYDISVSPSYATFVKWQDEYTFTSTFGLISVDKEAFDVSEVSIGISEKDLDSSEIEKHMYECISSMSALEYDETYDVAFKAMYEILQKGASSAFDRTVEIWVDEIMKNVDEIEKGDVNVGDEMIVYSGNYDYYVSSMNTDRGVIYYFTAKAREK